MIDPDLESKDINRELQQRVNKCKGNWMTYFKQYDLDHLAEYVPAINEKLNELKLLIELCKTDDC